MLYSKSLFGLVVGCASLMVKVVTMPFCELRQIIAVYSDLYAISVIFRWDAEQENAFSQKMGFW